MKQTYYKHPMPVCDHVRNTEDAVPRVGRVLGTRSSRAVALAVVSFLHRTVSDVILAQAHEEAHEEGEGRWPAGFLLASKLLKAHLSGSHTLFKCLQTFGHLKQQ